MLSIITIADVKIYVIQRSKRQTLKILQHVSGHIGPSSGSDNLYLIEITYDGSNVLIMGVVGVWRHIVDLWCVCVGCVSTFEPSHVISIKYRLSLPDDGSYVTRNMLQYFNVCLLDFCITQILTTAIVITECISWLIKVTDSNDVQPKP
jgi:hypothetical protein